MEIYDLLILGGGPAGLTAGIYAGRARLKSALLERLMPGGEVATTEWVENYPGFEEGIAGAELMQRMERQARRFGLEILSGQVERLEQKDGLWEVSAGETFYRARAVIVATGCDPKALGVPGEKEFKGRGVSYCATCDGPFFQDKEVVVVGGGNSGLQESLYLTRFVRSIHLIEFQDRLTAEKILQDRAVGNPQFTFYLHHQVLEIRGDKTVNSVLVEDRHTGEQKEIPAAGVFIWIGLDPNTAFLRGVLQLDAWGFVVTDEGMRTSLPGIFAAGDVRSKEVRQITTAVADATIAIHSALKYLEGETPV